QTAYAGHCTDVGQTAPAPLAATVGEQRASARRRAQVRALYDPDPMDEVIPRPRPPGEPDGSDPGEIAEWVGRKFGRRSGRRSTSEFGVPSGTARSVPATTSEPGARSLSGARSSPAADSPPGNESPPGAGSSVLVESPAAVLENQLGIMATDA